MNLRTDNRKQDTQVGIRLVLVAPPAGVDFGIQEGKGHDYRTILTQRSGAVDLTFEFRITVRGSREDSQPDFAGSLVQGPVGGRFIYIDIGKYAGQTSPCWERRMKVPLAGISWDMIDKASAQHMLEARLPGTGRDGGPACATVKPPDGWTVRR